MAIWFEIISELFVNIAAAWFGAVFIGSQISFPQSSWEFLTLIIKFGLGIISLFAAKYFREKSRRRRR